MKKSENIKEKPAIAGTAFSSLAEPENGLVIMDASVLSLVAQLVDEQYLTRGSKSYKPQRRWADGLFLLADRGFKVVIPQMVAYESGNTDYRGNNLGNYFKEISWSKKLDLYKEIYADSQAFLKNVVAANNPNISIEPPNSEADSEPARVMRDLNQARDNGNIPLVRNIIRYLGNHTREDYGDIAAIDMVKALPKGWSKPIFYMVNDDEAIAAMRAARPDLTICEINDWKYFAALSKNGIFDALDINPNTSINKIRANQRRLKQALKEDTKDKKWGQVHSKTGEHLQVENHVSVPADNAVPLEESVKQAHKTQQEQKQLPHATQPQEEASSLVVHQDKPVEMPQAKQVRVQEPQKQKKAPKAPPLDWIFIDALKKMRAKLPENYKYQTNEEAFADMDEQRKERVWARFGKKRQEPDASRDIG